MRAADALRLLLLSAIWGASFLFIRVASPAFGPLTLMLLRVGIASLCLAPVFFRRDFRTQAMGNLRPLFVVGVLNSALPFSLLAFAALSVEAGFSALLNATTPLFAAAVGAVWLKIPLRRGQVFGLLLGFAGVATLAWGRLSFRPGGSGWAIAAALGATLSYGIAAHYTKRKLSHVSPRVVTAGSMTGATLALLVPGILLRPQVMPSFTPWACLIGLAVLCTALGYSLYFSLLAQTGATAASTVTFVVPVFAILWGAWFLHEAFSPRMAAGMAVTLLGTAFTTGLIRKRG